MISRVARLAFIPWCPIAMPSLTVIVLNRRGVAPASFTASATAIPWASRLTLQGVASLQTVATPTKGCASSLSPKPMARSMARLAVLSTPSVMTRECWRGSWLLMARKIG